MDKIKRATKFGMGLMVCFMLTSFFGQNNRKYRKVNRIANRLVKKGKIPGMAITVMKNGQTLLNRGYGYADVHSKTRIEPSKTMFRIASVSKSITAAALGKLIEEEKIDLEASLHAYVPYFPDKAFDFTIKQLGSHTAGIRSYKGNEFMLNRPLNIEQGVCLFEQDSLLFKPGDNYYYSSYGFNLLSLAMQEAAGQPFESYVKEKVLDACQMNHTCPDNNSNVAYKATFYRTPKKNKPFVVAPPVNNYYKMAGGGFLSTAVDVAMFGDAILQNKLMPIGIKNQLLTAGHVGEKSTYYGIGWQVSKDHKGRPYYGHVGNGLGGYSILYVYPESGLVFSILINSSNPNIDEKIEQIIDAVFDAKS